MQIKKGQAEFLDRSNGIQKRKLWFLSYMPIEDRNKRTFLSQQRMRIWNPHCKIT